MKRKEAPTIIPVAEESDILKLTPLGAGNEVGRSCILLEFKGKSDRQKEPFIKHNKLFIILWDRTLHSSMGPLFYELDLYIINPRLPLYHQSSTTFIS